MGDDPQDVITAAQQQTREDSTELCISRISVTLSDDEDTTQELVVNRHQLVAEERSQLCIGVTSPVEEETKQQVMITPQQQATQSEDKSELSIGYTSVKLPTNIVTGISLVNIPYTGSSFTHS